VRGLVKKRLKLAMALGIGIRSDAGATGAVVGLDLAA
jgi:hypothetical protein